jgi:uncharacterized protein (TIGR01777 family)
MKIVVAGGGGFLGASLCGAWADEGHEVLVLTRSLAPSQAQHEPGTGVPGVTRVGWNPATGDGSLLPPLLETSRAVVNLAGESLDARRWSDARKRLIRDSRISATRTLVHAIGLCSSPPSLFLSGSAVGYYGNRGADILTEDTGPGDDFLARVCVDWEAEALNARRAARIVVLRTGLVLERSGGVLKRLIRPFRFGVGGHLGSGRQYMSWIHRLDWIEMVRWIVDSADVAGPVNATAPNPVTNAELSRALGRAMHRPSLVPVPAFALRAAVGDMASAALSSQRALPARANAAGFHFRYPEIDIAFRGIFGES